MSRSSASKSVEAREPSFGWSRAPSLPLSARPRRDFAKFDDCNDLADLPSAVWQHRLRVSGDSEQAITNGYQHLQPAKWPYSSNSWLFCRQRLHAKLDNHRRRWKNTLELIILPVSGGFYRPTWLPAWPFAGCLLLARGSGNSQQRIHNAVRRDKGHLNALRIVLGKRYPSEPWLWVFVFRFDPDQVSAADLRYTSAE
jgi:hypothetical protein